MQANGGDRHVGRLQLDAQLWQSRPQDTNNQEPVLIWDLSSALSPAARDVMRNSVQWVLVFIGCCHAALALAAADTASAASAFPNWVFGNHTACSACSHGVPIDVDSSNSKAYSRALKCSSSQVVVIVPGDTPIHTTRPLQMVS